MAHFGSRFDWKPTSSDTVTLQGDYYDAGAGGRSIIPDAAVDSISIENDIIFSGGNALLRWTHVIDDDSNWSVQCYYDRTDRLFRNTGFGEARNTYDLDTQYQFAWVERHKIICGFDYRYTDDCIVGRPLFIEYSPSELLWMSLATSSKIKFS